MNTVASQVRQSSFLLMLALVAIAGAVLWFVTQKFHYIADYSLASYTETYWPRRTGLLPHLAGGATAITVGLVQIWLGLTNRIGALHRALGKFYVAGVLIGSVGGFYLALTIPGHLAYSAGLFSLCIAWLVTTGMALYAIKSRRIGQHREWMLRSYTVTFAFVMYRLASTLLEGRIHVAPDPVADDLDTLLSWACWAIPLLLMEPLIQLRAMRLPGRAQAMQAPR